MKAVAEVLKEASKVHFVGLFRIFAVLCLFASGAYVSDFVTLH